MCIRDRVGTEYTYTSADENTATVDENGVVTGVAAGETTITVENELGQKTDCKVVVTEPVRQTTSRPAGNNGGNGNTGNGSNTGAATPNQPSGGNGGGSTPAPTPDPTPAPQPDPCLLYTSAYGRFEASLRPKAEGVLGCHVQRSERAARQARIP